MDKKQIVRLKFDGRWDFIPGENRQWTVMSDFFDKEGRNRIHSSFCLEMLKTLGVVAKERSNS